MPTNYLGENLAAPSNTVTAAEAPTNSNATTSVPNNYVICERTGFKIRPDELVTEWNGSQVRRKSFETRHPQDFVRGKPERLSGSPSPEQTDQYIEDLYPNMVSASDL